MKKSKFRTVLTAVLLILLLLSLSNFAAGKYKHTFSGSGEVTFQANLAEEMTVTPPEEIKLIPGCDMTLNYRIDIKNKSDIPARLTVEVVEDPNFDSKYLVLSPGWEKVTDTQPTYVYEGNIVGTADNRDLTVYFPVTCTVSQNIRSHTLTAEKLVGTLNITAKLDEIVN